MSPALPQGECFGMLGSNGAGKTSFINMMIGLIKPSSGMAYVEGLDIQMKSIPAWVYVCPQHDLLTTLGNPDWKGALAFLQKAEP